MNQIQTIFNFSMLLDNKATMESFDKFTRHIIFKLMPDIESKGNKIDLADKK